MTKNSGNGSSDSTACRFPRHSSGVSRLARPLFESRGRPARLCLVGCHDPFRPQRAAPQTCGSPVSTRAARLSLWSATSTGAAKLTEKEPLDIFSDSIWLPGRLDKDHDTLGTSERSRPIINAHKRTGAAAETDSACGIPGMPFRHLAMDAKRKISFGSSSGAGGARGIDFCVERAGSSVGSRRTCSLPSSAKGNPSCGRRFSA